MAKIKGGKKLREKLEEIARKATSAGKVRVGFLENATYPDGTSVAQVAFWQNFGTKKVPPTMFFSNAVKDKGPDWGEALGRALVASSYDSRKALAMVGEVVAGDIREAIIAVDGPPLSPITLMLRKMFGNHPELITGKDVAEAARRVSEGEDAGDVSTKRLVWSGHMLNSVDYEVT